MAFATLESGFYIVIGRYAEDGVTMSKSQQAGTQDVTYNLVSVIYHALQGAETCDIYTRDAEKEGDQELARFFKEVKEQNQQTAEKAKSHLGKHLG